MTPQRQFLGNVLVQAREFGRDVIEPLRDAFSQLGPEMFQGADRRLYEAMSELLDEDRLPSAGTLRLKLPEFSAEHAGAYIDAAGDFGEWKTYAEAIHAAYRRRVVAEGLSAASAALQEGRADEALALMAQAVDEAPSRGAQALEYVTDFGAGREREPRITVPWPRLGEHLGGGLGFQGSGVMSLWVADSGVGKSTVAQQMVLHWLREGHHVLYCFGEGRREDITRELSRLQASLGYDELRYGEERRVPLVLDRYARAAGDLAALPGRLAVYDEEFDGQTVRDLARRYRRALSQAQAAGEAGEHARLIVVIDNIDSAVTFDNKRFSREDQAYEYEAKRFEQAAKRDSYHLAVLSQTNDEGRRRQGAPEKSDIARAKVLMNRAAFVVTLHRPITEADRTQTDKEGEPGRRARTWIAVRKARGGKVDELEFATNPRTGQWFDPQQPAF